MYFAKQVYVAFKMGDFAVFVFQLYWCKWVYLEHIFSIIKLWIIT